MATKRTETVTGGTSSSSQSNGTQGKRPGTAANAGKGAAKIGGAIGDILGGVIGQATGRPQPSVPANAGIGKRQPARPAGQAYDGGFRNEQVTPQYQAVMNQMGRFPDANGSYAGPPPSAQGRPGNRIPYTPFDPGWPDGGIWDPGPTVGGTDTGMTPMPGGLPEDMQVIKDGPGAAGWLRQQGIDTTGMDPQSIQRLYMYLQQSPYLNRN